jgi:hypothetical protein
MKQKLSVDSFKRENRNPMRILLSQNKKNRCQKIFSFPTMTTFLDTVPFDCWFSVARWCDAATLQSLKKTTERFKRRFEEDECLKKCDYAAKRTVKEWRRPNGQLQMCAPYVHGQLHGVMKMWYPNGQLRMCAHYVHGKQHGVMKEWEDNGQLRQRRYWVHGKQNKRIR